MHFLLSSLKKSQKKSFSFRKILCTYGNFVYLWKYGATIHMNEEEGLGGKILAVNLPIIPKLCNLTKKLTCSPGHICMSNFV
jgi:hypothetical protein